MAQQARILDFEEVRSSSRRRTSAAGRSRARNSQAVSGSRRSAKSSGARTAAAKGGTGAAAAKGASKKPQATQGGKKTRAAQSASRKSRAQSRSNAKKSQIEQVKRKARTKKADREFSRSVKQETHTEEGPRAALYQTKMGSQHKKAARMQDGKQASGLGAGAGLNIGRFSLGRRGSIALIACLCVALSCAFLYVPAKNYYAAVRDQAKAEAALQVVSTRNSALVEDVALLSTEEGIEDRAREQYGWVKEGENAVTVTGLDEDDDPSAAEIIRTVTLNDVKAPETWYSPLLDSVFGYEG